MTTCGLAMTRDKVPPSVSRSWACARTPPVNAGELVITSTGLPFSGDANAGRDAQSIAFFNTPGMPKLYSGEHITTPSLESTAALNSRTASGRPGPSRSWL